MSAIGIEYNAKLQRIVREIKRDVDASLMPIIRQYAPDYVADSTIIVTRDGWADVIAGALRTLSLRWTSPILTSRADKIAGDFVQASLKKSERDLKKSVGIDAFSGNAKMQEYLRASSIANAQLIKSIPGRYLEDVSATVMENMRAGMRPSYITKSLQEKYGISERRAKFIARDQTGKINGDLAEKQQVAAGFEYFQWIDSDDSRVRHWHSVIANRVTEYGKGVYRWDNLPLNEKGIPIKPGQDYGCRCTSKPISARQVAENQRKGLTVKGVTR